MTTDAHPPQDGERFERGASTGVFIGVSRFEDERVAEVPFAVDDAVDLAHLFACELNLLLPERTVLALSGEPKKGASRQRMAELVALGAQRERARQPDFYRLLGDTARRSGEEGVYLAAVATHGLSNESGDFLVAEDSLVDHLLRTGVAVDELFDQVSDARAERRLVLLDACRERLGRNVRSGTESAMSWSFADAIARTSGLAVLSGTTHGGYSYDDPKLGNGVFTDAILEGLRGAAAADASGYITVRTLADFVQHKVREWVRLNRPDHEKVSRGIGRRIEGPVEGLPLAIRPGAAVVAPDEEPASQQSGPLEPDPPEPDPPEPSPPEPSPPEPDPPEPDSPEPDSPEPDPPEPGPPGPEPPGPETPGPGPSGLEQPARELSFPSGPTAGPARQDASAEPPRGAEPAAGDGADRAPVPLAAVGTPVRSRRRTILWIVAAVGAITVLSAALAGMFRCGSDPPPPPPPRVSTESPEECPALEVPDWMPAAGTVVEGPLGIHFRVVPPGDYKIGSPPGEEGRDDSDLLRTEIQLSRGFLLAETELTRAQWVALDATASDPSKIGGCGDDCPVDSVSWFEAAAYANALSRQEGLDECYTLVGCAGELGAGFSCRAASPAAPPCSGYRLPTEVEWEVAARAGSLTATYAGDLTVLGQREAPQLESIAWYGGNSRVDGEYPGGYDCSDWQSVRRPGALCGPRPVGRKDANAWEFVDLLGNVSEWTGDWLGESRNLPACDRDPAGRTDATHRAIRGGSWYSFAANVRAADREDWLPGHRDRYIGFRLARSLLAPGDLLEAEAER